MPRIITWSGTRRPEIRAQDNSHCDLPKPLAPVTETAGVTGQSRMVTHGPTCTFASLTPPPLGMGRLDSEGIDRVNFDHIRPTVQLYRGGPLKACPGWI